MMGPVYHNVELWFRSCLLLPKGVCTFALSPVFMTDKLEADKRESKKLMLLLLFTILQNMAEMSYSN